VRTQTTQLKRQKNSIKTRDYHSVRTEGNSGTSMRAIEEKVDEEIGGMPHERPCANLESVCHKADRSLQSEIQGTGWYIGLTHKSFKAVLPTLFFMSEQAPARCPLCGSDDILIVETEDGYEYYVCQKCGRTL